MEEYTITGFKIGLRRRQRSLSEENNKRYLFKRRGEEKILGKKTKEDISLIRSEKTKNKK